ncbi:MAG TPA: ATP-binding protein [Thermoanaerobaculia bacterium]|nr:ATP-binding protein [Thermoanaerobaculia bacterium]
MRARAILQYRKDPRLIVAIPLLLVIATSLVYYLVQQAKELSPEALSSRLLLFVLWNVNLILILGILFVLLRGIVKLLLERQRGILGSRFRTKLVATYVVTSLLPILVLFLVATDLLRVSVDRWFNMPVRTLLQNSEKIAEMSQERAVLEARAAATELAESIDPLDDLSLDRSLGHVQRYHSVDFVGVYQDSSVLKLLADPRSPVHEAPEPPARFFAEVSSRGSARKIDVTASGKWIRFAVPVGGEGNGKLSAVAGVFIPGELSRMLDENIIAQKNFEQLDSQRPALKTSQTSLFLTVTLSILFGTLWTSIFVSRRITVPIQALAEGTRTLGEGNYSHRIGVKAADEFGLLIDSFNRMSEQLESQRGALTESNVELQAVNRRLDEERAYLSTVLDSVSTGIIAFTDQQEILSVNRAALEMLHLEPPQAAATLRDYFRGDLSVIAESLRELQGKEPRVREVTVIRRGQLKYLEISAARLASSRGKGGWVLAIEDLTQLVQAQKLAAWSEAARRIAHEIKNPLTPIQLSAERIARKFRHGDSDTPAAIEEGCNTIVHEVGQLKRMVDEFSRFASMPAVHLRQTAVSEILHDVARLYRDVKPGVEVRVEADDSLQLVVDPEQIRRAIINLLDNAIEATSEGTVLLVARRREGQGVIEVIDPGRGVPDIDKERLFLPYFSTKNEGTGLGLAIVHRIVHDHQGRISVHDRVPHGTRFEIELPA